MEFVQFESPSYASSLKWMQAPRVCQTTFPGKSRTEKKMASTFLRVNPSTVGHPLQVALWQPIDIEIATHPLLAPTPHYSNKPCCQALRSQHEEVRDVLLSVSSCGEATTGSPRNRHEEAFNPAEDASFTSFFFTSPLPVNSPPPSFGEFFQPPSPISWSNK